MSSTRQNQKINPRKWILGMILFACFAFSMSTYAGKTAVGYWQAIDNMTNKPGGIVEIWRTKDGKYFGKIIKDSPSGTRRQSHGKRYVGLTILRNLQWNPKTRLYENGKLTDPRTGKQYNCFARLLKGNKKLQLRGYLGIHLLGKTTTWTRVGKLYKKH